MLSFLFDIKKACTHCSKPYSNYSKKQHHFFIKFKQLLYDSKLTENFKGNSTITILFHSLLKVF